MSKKQWKAGVIVALSLVFVAWSFWPAQAGSSTKGNSADKMSQNFDFVTSPDDAAVDITDVLLGGFVFDDVSINTVDEGDSGYARMSADRRIYVDADITGPVGAAALALDTSVDGLEGGLGAAADAAVSAGAAGSVTAKLRLMTTQLSTIDTSLNNIETDIGNDVLRSKTLFTGSYAGTAVANGAYLEIVADPGDNLAVHIVALSITQTVQGLVSLWDETGGTPVQVSEGWYFPAYGGINLVPATVAYFTATQESENFGLKNETGSACSFAGTVMWYVEDITP